MKSKVEQWAREWIQTKYPEESKLVGGVANPERERDFIEGCKRLLEEAEKMAVKPEPLSATQWEPYINLKDLRALFEPKKGPQNG